MSDEPILTAGEWEAMLFGVPEQYRHLIARLALRHGHLKATPPDECPVCRRAV
jgi:hypothetical protein